MAWRDRLARRPEYNSASCGQAASGMEHEPIESFQQQGVRRAAHRGDDRLRLVAVAFLRRRVLGRHPGHHLRAGPPPHRRAPGAAAQSGRLAHAVDGPAGGHHPADLHHRFAGPGRRQSVSAAQERQPEFRRLPAAGHRCPAAHGARRAGALRPRRPGQHPGKTDGRHDAGQPVHRHPGVQHRAGYLPVPDRLRRHAVPAVLPVARWFAAVTPAAPRGPAGRASQAAPVSQVHHGDPRHGQGQYRRGGRAGARWVA